MARHKDGNWNLPERAETWERVNRELANTALLMDIRDELRAMNIKLSVLQRPDFLGIPRKLERIARNTVKPKRKKAT